MLSPPWSDPRDPLRGRYDVLEELSRRENRLVLRCRVPAEENRNCVVKCLLEPATEAERDAFRTEYLLLDALEHPNWVRPHCFTHLADGSLALELEEIGGVPLGQWPLRGWWPENLEIARQLLSALQALHRLGVAQLDLHPDQVLVNPVADASRGWEDDAAGGEIRVRLLDLGLAAPFGSLRAGRGTPGYLAPELLDGQGAWDERADLYAAGACFFELFTGQRAFRGSTGRERLAEQFSGVTPDPGSDSGLPPRVRSLLADLLQRDPARRPRSALGVWQVLREQAPRRTDTLLPSGLHAGRAFAFLGREQEVARFRAWLGGRAGDADGAGSTGTPPAGDSRAFRSGRVEGAASAPEHPAAVARCHVRGPAGSGRHRLVARLLAHAQADGWEAGAAPEGTGGDGSVHRPGRTVIVGVAPDTGPPPGAAPRTGAPGTAEGASPPAEPREAVRGSETLVIALAPLDPHETARILEGRGMESSALRAALAAECLGLPGLLHAIVQVLPREADLAARYAAEASLVDLFASIAPPAAWIDHVTQLLADATPAARDAAVLLALSADAWEREALVALWPGARTEVERAIETWRDARLLAGDAGPLAWRSELWRRAVLASAPAAAARLARKLARGEGAGARLSAPVRARLALHVGDLAALAPLLATAVRASIAQEADEEALCLWRDACRAGLPAGALYAPEAARPLLDAIAGWSVTYGSPLPSPGEFPEDPEGRDEAVLLRAWSALLARDFPLCLGLIEAVLPDPRLDFGRRILRARSLFHLGRHAEAAAEIESVVPAGDAIPHQEERIAVVRAELAGNRGDSGEAIRWWTRAAAAAGDLPLLDRVYALHGLGLARFQRGEIDAARSAMAPLEDLVARPELRTHRGVIPSLLAGIAFQEGRLREGQAWLEALIGFWLTRGVWNRAAISLYNLGLILIECGSLGRAARLDRDLEGVCQLSGEMRELARISVYRCHLFARSGQLDRAVREAEGMLERFPGAIPRHRLLVEATRAEALAGLGRREESRQAFRSVVARFDETGGREDALESLLHWALRESERGQPALAAELVAEFDATAESVVQISPLTASLRALAGGEAALLTGDAARAVPLLAGAVARLEEQERWFFAWRAHWRLAQALRKAGNPRGAAEQYATARSILTGIVESLGAEAPASAFLALPAIERFLEDLEQN